MKERFIYYLVSIVLLLLFYPGNSSLYHTYAYNRQLFNNPIHLKEQEILPVPFVKPGAPVPVYSAQAVYAIDLESFTPVLQQNQNMRLLPASTAKIITALVVFDMYKPDKIITVKQPLIEGQVMGLVDGEKITVENLMYGILVHSGNDAAYALAQEIGVEEFARRMNAKAQSLHMNNSLFSNPAGLDMAGKPQYTSALDLSLASRALLKNPYLAKFVSTKEITVSDEDFKYFHKLANVNKLLGEVQGVGGLKTGYTLEAGENLVSFYKAPTGHQYIIVVLKSLDRFQDSLNIIQWIPAYVDYTPVATE
jgi:D-alanyl-D-alanine carboxypeptidase